MNLSKLSIDILNEQINILKQENLLLKLKLDQLNNEWVHPKSCLHNSDPWREFIE
jgi:hypothetical protein